MKICFENKWLVLETQYAPYLYLDFKGDERFVAIAQLSKIRTTKSALDTVIPIDLLHGQPTFLIVEGTLLSSHWQSVIETYRKNSIIMQWRVILESRHLFDDLFRIVKATFQPLNERETALHLIFEPAGTFSSNGLLRV